MVAFIIFSSLAAAAPARKLRVNLVFELNDDEPFQPASQITLHTADWQAQVVGDDDSARACTAEELHRATSQILRHDVKGWLEKNFDEPLLKLGCD